MEQIALIRPGGERVSRDTEILYGIDRAPLAVVSQAPPLLIDHVLGQLRASPPQPAAERLRALTEAGKLFAGSELDGETPERYERRVSGATGVPITVVRAALPGMHQLMSALPDMVEVQRPAGAQPADDGPVGARWVPRGRVLGVVAPSNHPMVHIEWLLALALGYRIAVRPGHRDPFTPRRLARALFAAGLRSDWLAVLPGPHAAGERLVQGADLGLVYGTERVVARHRGSNRVLTRGPGRTKALLTGSEPSDPVLDRLLEEIAGDGGVRCTNISVVLCESGHDLLADALASRLSALPALSSLDERAVLPVHDADTAVALRAALDRTLTAGATLVSAEPLVRLPGNQAVLLPAVVRCDRPDHPALRAELPFPCVWVAPWRRADGIAALRDSLALLLPAGCDAALRDELLAEPSIRTIVDGCRSDWWQDPLQPHDGYLGDFLMETRGYVAVPR